MIFRVRIEGILKRPFFEDPNEPLEKLISKSLYCHKQNMKHIFIEKKKHETMQLISVEEQAKAKLHPF